MVPPLRRFSSIAYGVQAPLVVLYDNEIHREPAEHAERREMPSDHHRGLGDARGVGGVGREHAAEVLLTALAAEQLVVGGQQFDRAVGQRPHLDAGTGQRDSGDPLLDDAAVLLERGQVGLDGQLFGLQLHAEQALA